MATIEDVAKLAGLSRTTVSRVMNNHPYVSEEKKKRVKQAMEELGFVPNSAARRLRNQKTEIIAVLVPRVTNPFFSKLIESLEMKASERNYCLIICQTHYNPQKELDYIDLLRTKQVDGMIICSMLNKWEALEPALDYGPIIFCNEFDESIEAPGVRFNQVQGAYIAVQHLIKQGHSRMVFCSGHVNTNIAKQREVGILKALHEGGLLLSDQTFISNAYELEDGYNIFHQWSKLSPKPTAIFAGGDEIAAGIIMEAKRNGVSIPEELAVVGFDNQAISIISQPAITTIDQPVHLLANKVIEIMIEKIKSKNYHEKEIYEFDLELIERESTKEMVQMEEI
ncbi:MAG: LacI family DNA-binding transcriptional regulator [Bacillaceae bacterium]